MTLNQLMNKEYVAARYELEPITIIAPQYNGQAFVAVGTRVDAEVVKFYASGKSEVAAIVNLAAQVCKFTNSPDVEEHIFAYYQELPKYANTPEGQLWEFADQLAIKFRVAEVITEYMMDQIETDIENTRSEYTESQVYVRVSDAMIETYRRSYDIWLFEATATQDQNWCAVCDKDIEDGKDLCDSCAEHLSKY